MILEREFKYKTVQGEEKTVGYIGFAEDAALISPWYSFIDGLKNLMNEHNVKTIKFGTIGFDDDGEFVVKNCRFESKDYAK